MKNTAIKGEMANCTCMNCLEQFEKPYFIFKIEREGYFQTDYFDGTYSEIRLCASCYEKSDKEMWINDIKFEKKLFDYIESFPLAGKELFKNRLEQGWKLMIEPQDWIDYELGVLPEEKCLEYGLLSCSQVAEECEW